MMKDIVPFVPWTTRPSARWEGDDEGHRAVRAVDYSTFRQMGRFVPWTTRPSARWEGDDEGHRAVHIDGREHNKCTSWSEDKENANRGRSGRPHREVGVVVPGTSRH